MKEQQKPLTKVGKILQKMGDFLRKAAPLLAFLRAVFEFGKEILPLIIKFLK